MYITFKTHNLTSISNTVVLRSQLKLSANLHYSLTLLNVFYVTVVLRKASTNNDLSFF